MLDKIINNKIKPKTSEASQFHQPPHEPSWRAHQLPKNKVIVIKNICTLRTFFRKNNKQYVLYVYNKDLKFILLIKKVYLKTNNKDV